jgi:hypothetical protein
MRWGNDEHVADGLIPEVLRLNPEHFGDVAVCSMNTHLSSAAQHSNIPQDGVLLDHLIAVGVEDGRWSDDESPPSIPGKTKDALCLNGNLL